MMRFGNIRHYDFRHKTIIKDLSNQRFQLVVNTIQHVFNCIPPMDSHNADFFHYFYYMMIRSPCPFGRVIDTDNKIFVLLEIDHQQFAINFSCTYPVQDLLMQLNASRGIFSTDSDVYKIAIHFDTNKRTIDDWNAEMPEPTPVIIPEKQISTIQKTKIFIASSNDLSYERKEIALWASRKNKKLIGQNQYGE
jgi:copper chaperone CopZ